MIKSFFLLVCCAFLYQGIRAQALRLDTSLPQKLQFKKTELSWSDHPIYFGKKSADTPGDSVRSLMYTGPTRKDSIQLGLPMMKSSKVNFQIKAGARQPLFRSQ